MNTSDRKNLGQYFTPVEVAEFMCSLITKPKDVLVLEPCAGTGVFLSVLERLGFRNIVAYEIDSSLPNRSSTEIIYEDFLKVRPEEKFDVVIGNPPYVRWKNIPREWREMFKRSSYWSNVIGGLSDLTYAFIYHSVNMLKSGGELIFITPVFWMETVHGSRLRSYIAKRGHLEVLINFNEMKIFEEVSSTIAIFKYVKTTSDEQVKVVKINSKGRLLPYHLAKVRELLEKLSGGIKYIREGVYEAFLHPQFKNGEPWLPVPHTTAQLNPLLRLETAKRGDRIVLLGDVTDIGNGMVSGLDEAFRLSPAELSKLNNPEKAHVIYVYKAHTLDRFYPAGNPVPYIYVNDVKSEEELKVEYPHFYLKLHSYKPRLLARYNYGKDIPWWHWVFPRNKHLFEKCKEKVFVPSKERYDTKGYFRFAYVEGTYYATQDVTVICPKSYFREGVLYLLALLNSKAYQEYIVCRGFTRGGVYDFSEKPLSRIPVVRIDWNDIDERRIYEELTNLLGEIIRTRNWKKYISEVETLTSKLLSKVIG